MKKVLLLPGWMTGLKLYKDNGDLDIEIGNLNNNTIYADYIIGLSLGALVVLQNASRIDGKIILINPPLFKRNILIWFIRWVKFITTDGLFFERQKFTKNPIKLIATLLSCIKLLNTDFSEQLNAVKDRLTIIRGKNDKYFCDSKAVKFINLKNIELIEVDGGHNWSEGIENALQTIMIKKEPTFEKEGDFEQRLVELFREKGVEDKDVRDALIDWTIEHEKGVQASSDPEAVPKFVLKQARLYFRAGYVTEAFESFEAARMWAWNKGRNELCQAIVKEMNDTEDSL